ncbi:hypothetical protein M094_1833 [Bacteroides uniformis str. 3978 T3 ii]|uniref:Uncharacterized protein n=1 Tax=Bacteroides uniformis str. 3978 T3 ii TaxID=1339349 RepID=A0A078RXK2_BACUN|nr:hypothetical protein M094_1833 [Bacteroides uniformis str. 3978 T3 ii]
MIHLTNRIEYIVTLRHFYGREVTGSFRNTWFCCHNQFNYFKNRTTKLQYFID